MGAKILRKLQLGQEVTAGTKVVATTVWGGPADTIEDTRKVEFVKQDIGRLSPGMRSYTPFIGAQYEMPETECTFQQICHIMQGAFGTTSAGADGSGTDKIRVWSFPTGSAITPKTYSLEAGDDQQAYVMEYAFVDKFKLSGKLLEAVKMSATWTGRQRTKQAFTAALAVPTNLNVCMLGKGQLYIDLTTIGTTQISSTLMGFELDVDPGTIAQFAADGNLYFSSLRQVTPTATMKITFVYNASAVAEADAWAAETKRLIRLNFSGPGLGTPGTTYSTQTLRIDCAAKWSDIAKLGEDNGNDIMTGTLQIVDDGTTFLTITVVNEDTTIP